MSNLRGNVAQAKRAKKVACGGMDALHKSHPIQQRLCQDCIKRLDPTHVSK